jgi:hypothetical protein
MGKTREHGELVSDNLFTSNPSENEVKVGLAITFNGSTGIVSATSYYGDGSNLSGVVLTSDLLDTMLFS